MPVAAKRSDDDLFGDLDDLMGDDLMGDDNPAATGQPAAPAAADDTPAEDFFEDTNVPGQLALDVYQTKESIVIMAPVPGVGKGDVDLSLVDNNLTIRGSRRPPENVAENDYFAQELHWGEFSRSVVLPTQVKEEGAEAVLKDGMLIVRIPKAEQDKVKKIQIQ
ncbi:Hsp20/alpha crystallin family protein [Candidatus Microgenomates bacterium]|nr:Hsp20/alpha crystallin family protein [Candidatus Microgenomates bacterium]